MRGVGVNVAAYVLAIVVFVLAAFGVELGPFDRLDLAALGGAFFAFGHVLPR